MAEYDLISKTALLKHLDMAMDCKDCPRNINRKTYYDRCACTEVGDICDTITDFATFADVQPIRHGRWESEYYNDIVGCFCANCSECGYESTDKYKISESHRYCEYCGADMTGGAENAE